MSQLEHVAYAVVVTVVVVNNVVMAWQLVTVTICEP